MPCQLHICQFSGLIRPEYEKLMLVRFSVVRIDSRAGSVMIPIEIYPSCGPRSNRGTVYSSQQRQGSDVFDSVAESRPRVAQIDRSIPTRP